MNLRLPKSPNPHSDKDVEEGRQMVVDANDWLHVLDDVLEEEKEGSRGNRQEAPR